MAYDFLSKIKKVFLRLISPHVLKKSADMPRWVVPFKRVTYGLALAALVFLLVQSGLRWRLPLWLTVISLFLDYLVMIAFITDAGVNFYYTFPKRLYLRRHGLDLLVFLPILLNLVTVKTGTGLIILRNVMILFKVFTRSRKFSRLLKGVRLNTAQIVAVSFILTILVGTLLLTFPSATEDGQGASFVDALFTATSATCVTGLIVQDTPVYFSTFGQVVILVLIQLGGLGIMTYSAFIALLFGRFSLGQRRIMQEMFDEDRHVLDMIGYIVRMTLIVELAGMALLFARFAFVADHWTQALYWSAFHSVSAFCNAGFALFSNSLCGFAADPLVNFTIMGLIFLGGIGFVAVYDLMALTRKSTGRRRLSTHTRIVLWVSGICIVTGFLVTFFVEFDKSMIAMDLPSKLLTSLFQSVTTRTAGFNTLPMESMSRITLTVFIILMFIGASPGSTGGGIKTSTLAVLLLSVRAIMHGKESIEVFKRSIPAATVHKAMAILITALGAVAVAFLLLLYVEPQPFIDLLFETVSAFGTVGLSTGVTGGLTAPGKLIIIGLMYLGRIGPLTLVAALAVELKRSKIDYPHARVMIG